MSLEAIYVTRHGFRSNWTVDPSSGEYSAALSSPTGIAADPALTAHGVDQARQLAARLHTLDPPIERVYSSPYYRCLQTIEPFVSRSRGSSLQGDEFKIRAEPGLGEWYGAAPFEHPTPAAPEVLKTHFPSLDLEYIPATRPTRMGESLVELHDRVAATMHGIISQCDKDGVKAILICTHAAVVIAIGRVLTGAMPDNVEVEDFRAFTCGLSVYRRKRDEAAVQGEGPGPIRGDPGSLTETISGTPQAIRRDAEPPRQQGMNCADRPQGPAWRGRGIAGGWRCSANSDCSHLSGGEERGWRFSGDEAFTELRQPGFDAGLDLGVVVEGKGGQTSSTKTSTSSRL